MKKSFFLYFLLIFLIIVLVLVVLISFNLSKQSDKKVINCLNNTDDIISCPNKLEVGQKIKIGNQIFRFIRYTSKDGKYNECNKSFDENRQDAYTFDACGDSSDGDIKVLAEYNLYVGVNLLEDGTKDFIEPNEEGFCLQNERALGTSDKTADRVGVSAFSYLGVDYKNSIAEEYVNQYVKKLNELYNINVSGDLLTLSEFSELSNTTWIYNTTFWLKTPIDKNLLLFSFADSTFDYYMHGYSNEEDAGIRPVITISPKLLY